MRAVLQQLALGLTIAGLVASLFSFLLLATLFVMWLTDGTHCTPSNWPVC